MVYNTCNDYDAEEYVFHGFSESGRMVQVRKRKIGRSPRSRYSGEYPFSSALKRS